MTDDQTWSETTNRPEHVQHVTEQPPQVDQQAGSDLFTVSLADVPGHTACGLRNDVVRVRTTLDSPKVWFPDPDRAPLAAAIEDCLAECDTDDKLEITSVTTPEDQVTLLNAYPNRTTSVADAQMPLSRYTGDSDPSASARLNTQIEQSIKRTFGDSVAVDRCHADLRPVGQWPVATGRLVFASDDEFPDEQTLNARLVSTLYRGLYDRGDPYIYQVLLSKAAKKKYRTTVRLAVFNHDFAVGTDRQFLEIYDRGGIPELQQALEGVNLVSNFDVHLPDYYEGLYPEHGWIWTHDRVRPSTAEAAREIFVGRDEYQRLLTANMSSNDLYETCLGHPRFNIGPSELSALLTLPHMPYSDNRWDDIGGRSNPVIRPITTTLANTSRTTPTPRAETPRQERSGSSATEGSDQHGYGINDAVTLLRQRGIAAIVIEQDGESVADGLGQRPDGTFVPIEYEKTWNKPENYLKNVARAIVAGYDEVIIIAKTEKKIETIADNLKEPFNDQTDLGTLLYTRSHPVRDDDDRELVLPKSANETKWYVSPQPGDHTTGHKLKLIANGEVIAEGPIDEPLSSYDYDCPRVREIDEDTHVIESADGTELDRFDPSNGFPDAWTKVQTPHVPVQLSYAGYAQLYYLTRDGIERYDASPDWTEIQQKTARYEASINNAFLARYTRRCENAEIHQERVYEQYRRWAERQTVKKLPDYTRFGTARTGYETKRKGKDGNDGIALKNRAWIYPPDFESPALPDFDPDAMEEWEDKLREHQE